SAHHRYLPSFPTRRSSDLNIFNTDRRLQALVSLADDLRTVPQKKSVIYFSGGIQRTGTENESQLRAAINAATKANLSFYTVDIRDRKSTRLNSSHDQISYA